MSKPASKPRKVKTAKPATKKPAARKATKKPVAKKPRKSRRMDPALSKARWAPREDHPHPVGRALSAAVKTFKGDKGALADYLGIKRPNLSRALFECRAIEEGYAGGIAWPPAHVLKLSKVSGVPLHELEPRFYEPQMKTTRFRPVLD